MSESRLERQMRFLTEIDRLKTVERKSKIIYQDRYENSAEHSWHIAVMALVLLQHANEKADLLKVLKMLLIHDIVEIEAGDTFAYDNAGQKDKLERETQAAERIFGWLPEDQKQEMIGLWKEFEQNETPEARFANSLDRLQPMIHNYRNRGETWKKFGITHERVIRRNQVIGQGSETLWQFALEMLDRAREEGMFADDP